LQKYHDWHCLGFEGDGVLNVLVQFLYHSRDEGVDALYEDLVLLQVIGLVDDLEHMLEAGKSCDCNVSEEVICAYSGGE
jgi:hypothetical protein